MSASFHVVVLSCGGLGSQVANALRTVDGMGRVTLVTAPFRRHPPTRRERLERIRKLHGWRGLVAHAFGRLKEPFRYAQPPSPLAPSIRQLAFAGFHDADCLQALGALQADLGVLAGTSILKPAVFGIPRLGSINLHSGKLPEYRGAPVGFWELYNGEREVGISIHRVAAKLDAGPILRQELFPLDHAPGGDPLAYLRGYWDDVLRPNGVRMLCETVAALASGSAVDEQPQDPTRARMYRLPDHRAVRELERRVRARRKEQTR